MTGSYTPGSIVTTSPTRSGVVPDREIQGASWISSPTPWPVEWMKPRGVGSDGSFFCPGRIVS